MKNKYKELALVILLSVLSLCMPNGYQPYMRDHTTWLPPIIHFLNPSLLKNDFLLEFLHSEYTIFDELVVFLTDLSGLELYQILFILMLASRIAVFYLIYEITLHLTKNHMLSILVLLAIFLESGIGGSFISVTMITPCYFAFPFLLSAFLLFIKKRRVLPLILVGIGLVVHPITATPFLLYFYLYMLLFERKKIYLGIIPIIFLALWMSIINYSSMGFLTTLDPAWESILRLRTKYVFIDSSLYNKLFLTAAHVLIFVVVYKSFLLERQIKKIYWVLFVTSMTLFIIPIFTIEILKIDFFTQVQFYRTIFLLKMLNIIFFIHYTYSYFKTVKYNIIYKSMLLGVIASFIFYEYLIFVFMPITFLLWLMKKQKIRPIGWNIEMKYFLPFVILTIIFLANFSIEPKYFKDEKLMELCGWIKENMGIEDVFLVEPFSKDTQAVRTVCLRSVFFFWDDGTQAPFNRDYAFEWKKRYDITLELKNDPEKIYGIDYRIDYILSENELPLNLVFNNSKYFVYKIR